MTNIPINMYHAVYLRVNERMRKMGFMSEGIISWSWDGEKLINCHYGAFQQDGKYDIVRFVLGESVAKASSVTS
jgi:hypothetical protein